MDFLVVIVVGIQDVARMAGVARLDLMFIAQMERCQVDLIDMQAQEFEGFRLIMVYQDHLTKYVLLLPTLVRRELHTHTEFANRIVKHIVAEWSDCKLVHGKPRHPRSHAWSRVKSRGTRMIQHPINSKGIR
uniref:Uncharacterized protein n=1 Tax=Acrobeloides nanus TaxID=290746 RepID=A0A914EL34_9BILA